MKKILSAAVLVSLTFGAGAQTMSDAINFSQNIYAGTARTMAMGNAVTAVGGDLGSIGINPAGSAVAGYGQFVVSPGLSISASGSSYSPAGEALFGNTNKVNHTRTYLPNIGISMNMSTGNSWGLKNITFALVSNHTNSYHNFFSGFGANSATSRFAEFAVASTGIDPSAMGNYDSFYDSDINWDLLAGYNANLFSDFGEDNMYVGSSEVIGADNRCYVPGQLNQMTDVRRLGYKSDMVLNMGMNFNDNFFLGFNIGLPTGMYQYDEYFTESPASPDLFPITFKKDGEDIPTNFRGGTFDYRYIADISGVYAKMGFIWLPGDHLRIGAAIQTPTSYTITERWQYSAFSSFGNSNFDGSCDSPEGDYTYCLKSPWFVNAGLAWTFGGCGLISVDYEMADYSVMKFTDVYDYAMDYDMFREQNEENRLFAGKSHNLRVGGELRVNPLLSIRAGYTLLTCPERHYPDSRGNDITIDTYGSYMMDSRPGLPLGDAEYYPDRTSSISAGLGYSSPGSFFADFAVRRTSYPVSYLSPYYDYENMNASGEVVNVPSPRIRTGRSLWDAVVTVGWRF